MAQSFIRLKLIKVAEQGDRLSWLRVALLEASDPLKGIEEEELLLAVADAGVPIAEQGSGSPGSPFAHEPSALVMNDGVVYFRQRGGLDI